MTTQLPLGTGSVAFELDDCRTTIAEPRGGEAVDVRAAAEDAVSDPLGPDIGDVVTAGETVSIVVTDITRATPDGELVDVLCTALEDAGVSRDDITVVVGLGLHRPMTDDELNEMLGEYADRAINHDPDETVTVGAVDGIRIECNRLVAESDRVLATGMVEPHQYAGFSGGGKTVAIGAGGESLIRYTHGPDMLSRSDVRLGRIDGNPFRQAVDEAGQRCGLDFCLNVTHGPAGILDVAAGEPRSVVKKLANSAKEALSVEVDGEYDAVIGGVGAPKDANLYQTTRAATYIALGAKNPLTEGGRIVLPAELPEGPGQGTGEQRFYQWLSEAETAEDLYTEMRQGYEPGAQRAFVVARMLREHDVYITNSDSPAVVSECLMYARDRVEDAIEPGSDVLVVPDALNTLLV